jgi:DNA-binding beta-propeller fold protein YncE
VADGSLWVSDFKGSVVRIDPAAHRMIARIGVPAGLGPIAAEGGSVWLRSTTLEGCSGGLWLVRIDAATNRAFPRQSVSRGAGLAATPGAVWVPQCLWPPNGIDRLDRDGTLTARAPVTNAEAIVAGSGGLWAISHDGTVAEIDARTARVTQRYPAVAPLSDPNTTEANVLAPDETGAWVLSTGRSAILRIASGHVVRRVGIGPSAAPLLALARDGLWVAFADRLGARHRLERIDPDTGKVTATLQLGTRRPLALVPAGDRLCVITQDGNVLFIGA